MRALGLDLGSHRIGVAVSDTEGRVATPLQVIERSGDRRRDHDQIARLARDWEVEVVVVGLPRTLRGEIGRAATGVLEEVEALRDVLGLEVCTYDERLSTVSAQRSLMDRGMRSRDRRRVVDMVAATVILQAWLDSTRGEA